MTSPPYEMARTYLEGGKNLGIARKTENWVQWMMQVVRELSRVCKGLIVIVCEGQTRDFRYTGGPMLLAADLLRAGFNLRKPVAFEREGIPGSGGPDFWRNSWEWCLCISRRGKLPWSDNTATGHAPKWAPGGEMSHRLTSGQRRNQWGGGSPAPRQRNRDGVLEERARPSHTMKSKNDVRKGRASRGSKNGDVITDAQYIPPVIANPGNWIELFPADDPVRNDVVHVNVGGGHMGHRRSHLNEAPFPKKLVTPFVRCFAPPKGIVLDPFCGSATVGEVCLEWDRRFLGFDLRRSQVENGSARMRECAGLYDGVR